MKSDISLNIQAANWLLASQTKMYIFGAVMPIQMDFECNF